MSLDGRFRRRRPAVPYLRSSSLLTNITEFSRSIEGTYCLSEMDTSPLGGLSPELRNAIYELVVCLEKPIIISVIRDSTPCHYNTPLAKNALALTATSRQIRAESLPMFFGANTFELQTEYFKFLDVQKLPVDTLDYTADEPITPMRKKKATRRSLKPRLPGVWRWIRQIGEENAMSLRNVNIVLGTCDPAHSRFLKPLLTLRSMLAPLVKISENTNAVCTIVFDMMEMFDDDLIADYSFITDIRLPVTNPGQATNVLSTWYDCRREELKQLEVDGDPTFAYEIEFLYKHLNESLVELRCLLIGINEAANNCADSLF